MEQLETPVAFFVFNRPSHTQAVFRAIAQVRPTRLLLIADGPRQHKPTDSDACKTVRNIISEVDWPCEVSKNFAEDNLGCEERLFSGLDWVFSLVEEAIILEDDCLPDFSFFPFCSELLNRYRGDSRVSSISGTNLVEKHLRISESYWFSELGGNWGWATWRREWQRLDRYLSDWPVLKKDRVLHEIFDEKAAVAYWTDIFDQMYEGRGPNTWDYQWFYTRLKNHSLTIIPRVNLVSNIGFGAEATHTNTVSASLTPVVGKLEFPLGHPTSFVPLRSVDRQYQQIILGSFLQRIARAMRKLSRSIMSSI